MHLYKETSTRTGTCTKYNLNAHSKKDNLNVHSTKDNLSVHSTKDNLNVHSTKDNLNGHLYKRQRAPVQNTTSTAQLKIQPHRAQ